MTARVEKRNGTWQAYSPAGNWLGASSDWATALALALGEPVYIAGALYRSGSLSGVRTIIGGKS